MKVIEKGEGWSIEVKCTGKGNGDGGCSSILMVEKDDIRYYTWVAWYGDRECCYTIKCPVCGVETDIPESKIPSSVRSLCMSKAR